MCFLYNIVFSSCEFLIFPILTKKKYICDLFLYIFLNRVQQKSFWWLGGSNRKAWIIPFGAGEIVIRIHISSADVSKTQRSPEGTSLFSIYEQCGVPALFMFSLITFIYQCLSVWYNLSKSLIYYFILFLLYISLSILSIVLSHIFIYIYFSLFIILLSILCSFDSNFIKTIHNTSTFTISGYNQYIRRR